MRNDDATSTPQVPEYIYIYIDGKQIGLRVTLMAPLYFSYKTPLVMHLQCCRLYFKLY